MATKITPTLSHDKVQGSGTSDKVGEGAARIADLVDELDKQVQDFMDERQRVNNIIDLVPDENLQAVLRLKYINDLTMERAAELMGYSVRYLYMLHSKALDELDLVFTKFVS